MCQHLMNAKWNHGITAHLQKQNSTMCQLSMNAKWNLVMESHFYCCCCWHQMWNMYDVVQTVLQKLRQAMLQGSHVTQVPIIAECCRCVGKRSTEWLFCSIWLKTAILTNEGLIFYFMSTSYCPNDKTAQLINLCLNP